MLLAPATAAPPLFPRCRYDFFNFPTNSQCFLSTGESGSLFWCSFTHLFSLSDLCVSPISSSAIYMFFRSHPQRFICFYDFILSDLYVFSISSSDSTPGHRLQGYAASRCSLLSHLLGCPGLSWVRGKTIMIPIVVRMPLRWPLLPLYERLSHSRTLLTRPVFFQFIW